MMEILKRFEEDAVDEDADESGDENEETALAAQLQGVDIGECRQCISRTFVFTDPSCHRLCELGSSVVGAQ